MKDRRGFAPNPVVAKFLGLRPKPRKLFEKSLIKNFEECAVRILGWILGCYARYFVLLGT